MIAKSISIKAQGCKSGRCVAKAVVLTSGGLYCVSNSGLERVVRSSERNAGVSRGHSRAIGLKGRTVGVAIRLFVLRMHRSSKSG